MTDISRPKYLYKYRAFNVYTLSLLDSSTAFYADPRTFNDPIDSNPHIDVDIELPEIEQLFYRLTETSLGPTVAQRDIGYERYMSTEMGDYKKSTAAAAYYKGNLVHRILGMLRADIGTRGVLSLAARWNCPLMWSHYADEHRGLCIEYSVPDADFRHLAPVNYRHTRTIALSDVYQWKVKKSVDAEAKLINTIYYAKASDWRYEREWRDLETKPGNKAAPALVTGVIFGCRCDSSIIRAIVKLFDGAAFKVRFHSIKLNDTSFKLNRRPIDAIDVLSSKIQHPGGWEFRDGFSNETDSI